VKFFKLRPAFGLYPNDLELRHGWYVGGRLYRACVGMTPLAMPLQERLHATIEGQLWLSRWRLGSGVFRPVENAVAVDMDWRREMVHGAKDAPRNPIAYTMMADCRPGLVVSKFIAESVRVGVGAEVIGENVVKVPILGERDVAHADLFEFPFGPWVWQVASQDLVEELAAWLPECFQFHPVSVC